MEISNAYQRDIASIPNALSIFTLRQSLNQDGETAAGCWRVWKNSVMRYRDIGKAIWEII